MKKIKLISLALALALASCTQTENKNSITPDIYGAWQLESKNIEGINQPLQTCETQNTMQFAADGSYLRSKYSEGEEGCQLENMTDTEREFTFDGEILVMEYEDISQGHIQETGLVTNLTETSFDLSIEFDDDDAGYLTYHFVKID
ncbi:MAG: lipocalin family protein [Bacteroidota bacterium]